MNMDFGASKTPAEVIKEPAFGRTYFSLETFILELMVNNTEKQGKNLMS